MAANEFYLTTYDGSEWRFKRSFKLERAKSKPKFLPRKNTNEKRHYGNVTDVVLNRYKERCNKNIKYLFSSSETLEHFLLHNQTNDMNPHEKHLYQNLFNN